MGGLIVKALIVVALVAGIFNYVMYLHTGKAPFAQWDMSELSLPDVSAITVPSVSLPSILPSIKTPDIALPSLTNIGGDTVTVYKWVDVNGITHYTETKPLDAEQPLKNIEVITVDPNTNIVEADSTRTAPVNEPVPSPQRTPNIQAAPAATHNIKALIDEAKGVQTLMNERNNAINQALQ